MDSLLLSDSISLFILPVTNRCLGGRLLAEFLGAKDGI
jgi:hypothetical protein